MIIKTKFNLNDEVWLIEDQQVKNGIISCIDARIILKEDLLIVYGIRINNNSAIHSTENKIFKTKEELIASL